ncbi:MAG: hypothetical protein PHD32_02190 [Eubacteriales bacterium]|nr:hypothetical protein [Eubacteriales bacterium]
MKEKKFLISAIVMWAVALFSLLSIIGKSGSSVFEGILLAAAYGLLGYVLFAQKPGVLSIVSGGVMTVVPLIAIVSWLAWFAQLTANRGLAPAWVAIFAFNTVSSGLAFLGFAVFLLIMLGVKLVKLQKFTAKIWIVPGILLLLAGALTVVGSVVLTVLNGVQGANWQVAVKNLGTGVSGGLLYLLQGVACALAGKLLSGLSASPNAAQGEAQVR